MARFYGGLLGWESTLTEPDWVLMRDPEGGVGLSFQLETDHVAPAWPAGPGDQAMQVHLDIRVDDLGEGVERATAAGATLPEAQPQDDVRVLLDPAGHPFCLFAGTG